MLEWQILVKVYLELKKNIKMKRQIILRVQKVQNVILAVMAQM